VEENEEWKWMRSAIEIRRWSIICKDFSSGGCLDGMPSKLEVQESFVPFGAKSHRKTVVRLILAN
jgi:hypothetical protein